MTVSSLRFVVAAALTLSSVSPIDAQTRPATRPAARAVSKVPPRAVRQDIPLGPMIRRAFAAGTRDSTGRPGKNYWQNRTDYVINATLDTGTATIRASERITIVNNSPDSLTSLTLRLFQNVFQPGAARNDYITDITDGMILDSVMVDGVPAELEKRRKIDPDATIQHIALKKPFAAGSTHTVTIGWKFVVPNVPRDQRGERMGRYEKELFQVAQWYPQIAVYDDLAGWRNDPYLTSAEFYNEFGSFDVSITLPAGWLIGATGVLQNPEQVFSQQTRDRLALAMRVDTTVHVVTPAERGAGPGRATAAGPGMLTWRFKADLVNDFAFATSRSYAYDAAHANAPNPTPIHTLFLPENDYSKTSGYAKFALEFFARSIMPYDFPQLSIVDGPERGMEYPMVIFNGWGYGVTAHETGHQWFPMMVGSNETWYGFMDEGFNTYWDDIAGAEFNKTPIDRNTYGRGYRRIAGSELEAPMMWHADYAGPNYGTQTYTKAPVALWALGGIVGDSVVQRAFSDYAKAWKYKHPSPWDFYFFMSNRIGRELGWFWNSWFFTTQTFDQSLAGTAVKNGRLTTTVVDKGDMPMPILLRITYADSSAENIVRPVSVWFGGARRTTIDMALARGKRVARVALDPDNRFQDVERSDNSWSP